jgi:hypothetical protein
VTTHEDDLPIAEMWAAAGSESNVIFEPNRIMHALRPDLCIGVIGGTRTEIKRSFEPFLERADALVIVADRGIGDLPLVQSKAKLFRLANCDRISVVMPDWLRQWLGSPRVAERA